MDTDILNAVPSTLTGIAGMFVLLGCILLFTMRRWEMTASYLLFAIIEQQFGLDMGIRLLNYTVSPMDLLSGCAATAAGLRLLGRGRVDMVEMLWLLVFLSLMAAFAHGVQAFGFQSATISYRRFFYVSTAIIYMLSFPWEDRDINRLTGLWILTAVILALIAIADWLGLSASPMMSNQILINAFDSQRVLPASSTFILAQAGLIGLAAWSRPGEGGYQRLLSILCLVVMGLLYHRTVWVATFAGITAILLLQPRALARLGVPLVIGMLLTLALWTFQTGLGDTSLAASMKAAISEPFMEDSSYNWRLEGWQILVSRALSDGIATIVMGSGFGVGYARQMGWALVEYSPHNFYLEIFLNTGLLGLGLWCLATLETGVRIARGGINAPGRLDRTGAMALLVAIAFYNIPYTLSSEQGLLIGMLAAMVRSQPGTRT